jgi:hypothetical protein
MAHTDTVNSLNETINQSINQSVVRRIAGRSAEHALNVLVERIYQAWRKYKILTLISFDVKGAFNSVHSDVLVRRLRERRAPEQAVRWISDFCTSRKAKVVVGKYESEVKGIDFPGIP